MLTMYIRNSKHVHKGIKTLNLTFMIITDGEEKQYLDSTNTLNPIRIAVEALNNQTVNLLGADFIFKFLFIKRRIIIPNYSTSSYSALKEN